MDERKYIMAIISIPIEITPTGDQLMHTDLYNIEFTALDYLPHPSTPIVELNVAELFSQISNHHNEDIEFRDSNSVVESDDDMSDDFAEEDENTHISDISDENTSDIEDSVEPILRIVDNTNDDSVDGFETQSDTTASTSCINEDEFSNEGAIADSKFQFKPGVIEDAEPLCRTEIRNTRPFPASKTFRRARSSIQRFSRKTYNRLIHIPKHIIDALHPTPNTSR